MMKIHSISRYARQNTFSRSHDELGCYDGDDDGEEVLLRSSAARSAAVAIPARKKSRRALSSGEDYMNQRLQQRRGSKTVRRKSNPINNNRHFQLNIAGRPRERLSPAAL